MAKSLISKTQLSTNVSDIVGEYGSGYFLPIASPEVVFTSNDQTISGTKTFISNSILYSGVNVNFDSNTNVKFSGQVSLDKINNNTSFGIYNYILPQTYENSYGVQTSGQFGLITIWPNVYGIKSGDIVNFYFSNANNIDQVKHTTLKVNPGVLVNHNNQPANRNLIKFPDDSIYAGKAIRKIRYNSTVGNGYERINLTNLSTTVNPVIIRPLTRRLETFYDINVPSGGNGSVRALKFNTPTSFPFVQGTCMNLRFNFEADNTPCVISGYSNNNQVFLITGANYSFIQKERVILINNGIGHTAYEFKHW